MARVRSSGDTAAPARSDAYVGLLLISLLAQIAGVVFFYLDWSQYESAKPKLPPAATVPAAGGGAGGNAPAAGGPGGGPAGVPAGGGPAGVPAGGPAGAAGVPPAGAAGIPPQPK